MTRGRIEGWASAALVIATVLIGVGLFATVWASYRGVTTASEIVVRGQADALVDGIRTDLAHHGDGAVAGARWSERLAHVLANFSGRGLRYVALLDRGGQLVAAAGAAAAPPVARGRAAPPLRPGQPVAVGGRVRLLVWRPVRRPWTGSAEPSSAAGGPRPRRPSSSSSWSRRSPLPSSQRPPVR